MRETEIEREKVREEETEVQKKNRMEILFTNTQQKL